jgi:hypothetical protein
VLDNRAAVRVARDRQPGKGSIIPWRNESLVFPTGKDERIAAAHEQAAPCVGRRRRIVAAHAVEGTVSLVAAIDDIIEDSLVALRHVHGFDNVHIGRIFDHAVGVARRQVDVGNEGVTAVQRIDLAVRSGEDLLVGADGSERQSPERR